MGGQGRGRRHNTKGEIRPQFMACLYDENRRKSTKRCGLDRLNLIYAKRAVARPPNGLKGGVESNVTLSWENKTKFCGGP